MLIVALSWPEDGRLRPKHVAKYDLHVITASCLEVYCVLTVYNILYKFDNTQRDGLCQKNTTYFGAIRKSFIVMFRFHTTSIHIHHELESESYGNYFTPNLVNIPPETEDLWTTICTANGGGKRFSQNDARLKYD